MSALLRFAARWKYTITMSAIIIGLTAALAVKDPAWCWTPAAFAALCAYESWRQGKA
jgi:hypothetical protein